MSGLTAATGWCHCFRWWTLNARFFLSPRFQTELGYDILEIHDGPNLLSPLIGSFNGTQVPQFLFSSSNFLYLLFITDNSRSNVGFKILYESKSVTQLGFDIGSEPVTQTWAWNFTHRFKPGVSKLERHPFHVLLYLSASGVTVDSYSCLDPGIPVNGIRYGQDFSIGSTVSFGCDSGYRLSHEEPLVCEKNHWWSHPLPTCDGKSRTWSIPQTLISERERKT